jgi:MFS family permease
MAASIPKAPPTKKSSKWLYLVLPANIAYGPLSTLVTLYILALGGSVLNVAYAITLASIVAIPASFFWGKTTDMFNKRKTQILISYFGLAISLLFLLFVNNILGITLIYAFATFIMGANGTPLNLLVMERTPSQKWSGVFAKLQMISSLGATIGFVLSAVITGFVPLYELTIVLFFISVISIVLTKLYLYEPPMRFTVRNVLQNSFAIISRAIVYPLFIALIPSMASIKRLFFSKGQPVRAHNKLLVLYLASFVFFIGSGIFNTVYPAGLKEVGLTESSVFAILLFGNLAQTVTFNSYASFQKHYSKSRMIIRSLLLRGSTYALAGVAFLLFKGPGFFTANVVLYALASGLAYSVFYATWNVLVFEHIGNTDRGSALGVYTAVTGVATLLGALASGYIVISFGYPINFVISGAFIFMSLVIYLRGNRKKETHITALMVKPLPSASP